MLIAAGSLRKNWLNQLIFLTEPSDVAGEFTITGGQSIVTLEECDSDDELKFVKCLTPKGIGWTRPMFLLTEEEYHRREQTKDLKKFQSIAFDNFTKK